MTPQDPFTPFTLNGSSSYDIDAGDSVSRYQWDLDNDGAWFDTVYTFIIIPGEIKLLKEFFGVSAHIKNNAPEGIFDIIDTSATLLYPNDKLTLVDLSGAPQDVTKPIGPGGTIAAGAEEGVDWVLRGDKEGHHTVTVNVNGTLIPFNIDLQASNSGAVDVYGKPELEILFIVNDPNDRERSCMAFRWSLSCTRRTRLYLHYQTHQQITNPCVHGKRRTVP